MGMLHRWLSTVAGLVTTGARGRGGLVSCCQPVHKHLTLTATLIHAHTIYNFIASRSAKCWSVREAFKHRRYFYRRRQRNTHSRYKKCSMPNTTNTTTDRRKKDHDNKHVQENALTSYTQNVYGDATDQVHGLS